MTRILVADDHPVVRQGIRLMLQSAAEAYEIGEAGSAREVLEQLRRQAWDALVLDLNLPDRNGFDVLIDVKARYPALPVLILSVHPEGAVAPRLLKAGAAGYLNKESAPAALHAALLKVLAGGRYVSPALAEILAERLTDEAGRPRHEALSEREFQVLRLIAEGKPVGEIAEALHLSVNTVSTYRSRLLEKMGMASNAELTRYALLHRIVD